MARRVRNGDRLRRRLRQWPDHLTNELKAEIASVGFDVYKAVVRNAPVDQGDLARAARHVVSSDGLSVRVGYSRKEAGFRRVWRKFQGFVAAFQERGTKHHKAQPFVIPTWRVWVPRALTRIERRLNQALRRGSNL